MQDQVVLYLRKWFHHYVQGFYSTDESLQFHVRLKEQHTLRVVAHACRIANALSCSPEQLVLVASGALLHDIGRFKQYQIHRTFNDALSVNHAQLGLEILEEFDVLTTAGLSAGQQDIIKKAILYHNGRCLPLDMDEKYCLVAKIIRDADKLDIFSMLVTDDQDNQIPFSPELTWADHYSAVIIEDILQGRLVKPEDRLTSADLILFRLSWIFDINFIYSFQYISKQQYMERLIAMLPNTDDIQSVYRYVKKYIEQHISI